MFNLWILQCSKCSKSISIYNFKNVINYSCQRRFPNVIPKKTIAIVNPIYNYNFRVVYNNNFQDRCTPIFRTCLQSENQVRLTIIGSSMFTLIILICASNCNSKNVYNYYFRIDAHSQFQKCLQMKYPESTFSYHFKSVYIYTFQKSMSKYNFPKC